MKYWTVVLLRCQRLNELTEEEYGKDIYVAHVTAPSYVLALKEARRQVHKADRDDMGEKMDRIGIEPNEHCYPLCVMFEGYQEPKLFGFEE